MHDRRWVITDWASQRTCAESRVSRLKRLKSLYPSLDRASPSNRTTRRSQYWRQRRGTLEQLYQEREYCPVSSKERGWLGSAGFQTVVRRQLGITRRLERCHAMISIQRSLHWELTMTQLSRLFAHAPPFDCGASRNTFRFSHPRSISSTSTAA